MNLFTLTRASSHEAEGVTLRTSKISKALQFYDGDRYVLYVPELKAFIPFIGSRGGETLYSRALDADVRASLTEAGLMPVVGKPVEVYGELYKFLKTV